MNGSQLNFGLTADLSWNPIHEPLLTSSYPNYEVHTVYSNTDSIIKYTPDLVAYMDGENCNYKPNFYVEIPDISGCISKSSIAEVHLFDTVSPLTPIIKDVSVNNSGNSVISWEPSVGTDFYIIYILDANGAWITLDTLSSSFTSYEYMNSIADISLESYSIKAIDTCGNSRVRSFTHNSIYLTNSSDACDYSISLDWNDYINWSGGVSHYNVIISKLDPEGILLVILLHEYNN